MRFDWLLLGSRTSYRRLDPFHFNSVATIQQVHFHKIPLIRRSEMSEHDKPYQCPVATCPRGYGSAGGLKYHLSHAHPPEVVEEAVKSDPKGLKTRQMPARNRAVGYAEDDEDEFDEDEDGEYEEDV